MFIDISKNLSVTIVLFSYNQERYIEEAVCSVLAQDYDPLKILISDDCSFDSTYNIIKRLACAYKGNHKIECRQNEKNLGLIGHVNRVMSIIDSDLVVLAAGDDVSLPHRVSKIVDAYLENGKPQLIFSKALQVSPSGSIIEGEAPGRLINLANVQEVLDSLNSMNLHIGLYLGASGAWSCELWERYGSIKYRNCYEDIVMGFRAALDCSFYFIDEPLLIYRCGSGISSKSEASIKGKIKIRQEQIRLRLALAKQRKADILVCNKVYSSDPLKIIERQILLFQLSSIFYCNFLCFFLGFFKYPALVVHVAFYEFKFLLGRILGRE